MNMVPERNEKDPCSLDYFDGRNSFSHTYSYSDEALFLWIVL